MANETKAQTVQISTASGSMQCQLRMPAGEGKHPAMIVVPEAFGVTAGIEADCDRLAAAGYIALGIEIYHRTAAPGWTSKTFDFAEAGGHFKALTNQGLTEDVAAARDFLAKHEGANGKVGIIGFCVGGFAAYLGACRSHLAASVVFYGGGIVQERPQFGLKPLIAEKVTCPVLGLFGKDDGSIPQTDLNAIDSALTQQGVEHQIISYAGAGHAFSNPERPNYAAGPAEEAWSAALQFLKAKLG